MFIGLGRGVLYPAPLCVVPGIIYGFRGVERQHLMGSSPLLDGFKMAMLTGCSIPFNCQGAARGRNRHEEHVASYEALQPPEYVPP